MTEPLIRPALPGDLPQIEALLMSESLPLFEAERFLDTFWVAEADGNLVGCVALEIYEDTALLRSVATTPEQRGTGVGGKLCRLAVEQGKARGLRTLYLFTMDAAPFFAHLGFEPCTMEDFAEPARRSTQYAAVLGQPAIIPFLTAMQMSL